MTAQFPITEPITAISIPYQGNVLIERVIDKLNHDPEVRTLWKISNVMAIRRLAMTDHGILHFNIVTQNALTLARLLLKRDIPLSVMSDYGLPAADAELIVVLASLFHDIGMSVHRLCHEEFSLFLSNPILHKLLDFLPIEERTIVISEVLHAIFSHRSDGHPLTLEAGIVRVADALDMSEGRSRMPYDDKKLDIHSVSALAIDQVAIRAGRHSPIRIEITMNHTAGLFQVDQFLKKKVIGSIIDQYLEIKVFIDKGQGRQLFRDFYHGKQK